MNIMNFFCMSISERKNTSTLPMNERIRNSGSEAGTVSSECSILMAVTARKELTQKVTVQRSSGRRKGIVTTSPAVSNCLHR